MVPQADSKPFVDHELKQRLQGKGFLLASGGGIGKFGGNFSVLAYKGQQFWIDTGIAFPDHNTPGLYKKIPDLTLLTSSNPSAVFLTHAHEDHIGSFPFITDLLPDKLPIYASPYTISLLRARLKDNGVEDRFSFIEINQNQSVTLGPVRFSFFFLPHSIPQVYSLGVEIIEIQRKIFWTADFKTEGNEKRFSVAGLQNFAPVDYLFVDSTGAIAKGLAESESMVKKNLEKIISHLSGRIFITTFSSQVERIRGIFDIAAKHGRSVGLQGFSLKNHLRASYEAGEFDTPVHELRDPSPKNKHSVWLVAGCQAEEGSSFYRLARDELKKFSLNENDTLIFASSMIPGNESGIFEALNLLAKKNVNIIGIDGDDLKVHTSGHGKKDDIRKLVEWLKPSTVVPIHGDPIHFASLENMQLKKTHGVKEVFRIESGNLYDLTQSLTSVKRFQQKTGFIEEGEIHTEDVLYFRRKELSQNGVCTVVVQRGSMELLSFNYIGTSSEKFLAEKQETLRDAFQRIFHSHGGELTKQRVKNLREKIHSVNLQYLKKNPFVNLIFVEDTQIGYKT